MYGVWVYILSMGMHVMYIYIYTVYELYFKNIMYYIVLYYI